MSAEVETMFSVREKPWHGLGTIVQDAPNSEEALKIAGLDWEVISEEVSTKFGVIPNTFANIRTSDNSCLGVVSGKYQILQNKEAFDFTDNLIGGDVKYETAGSLFNGRRVWLLSKLPSTTIAGDKVDNYVCFTNSHDGKGSVKVCITPIRVVCNNTLNLALNNAERSFSIKHFSDVKNKIQQARDVLQLTDVYFDNLAKVAEDYCNVSVNQDFINKLLEKVYPINDDMSNLSKSRILATRDGFIQAYLSPDIAKFKDTAWGVINAASDVAGHSVPIRNTKTFEENRWNKIMDGHPLLDAVVSEVNTLMVH